MTAAADSIVVFSDNGRRRIANSFFARPSEVINNELLDPLVDAE